MAEPVVTVRGEASLECPPDLATLSVTVQQRAATAEQVRGLLAEAAAELGTRIDAFRSRLESSSSDGLHVGPVFGSRDKARVTGYRGSYATTLVLADLDALPSLVGALTTVEQVQVDGPWWSLRPQHPLQRQARLAAIADARQRADDYAAAFGATIVDLLEISDLDGGYGGGPRRFAMAAAAAAGGPPELDFEPAPQTVSAQVTVRFVMSPAVLDAPV